MKDRLNLESIDLGDVLNSEEVDVEELKNVVKEQIEEEIGFDEMMSIMNMLDCVFVVDENGKGSWKNSGVKKRMIEKMKEMLGEINVEKAKKAFKGDTDVDLVVPESEGYYVECYQKGIVTWRKDYKGGCPDFVTEINLQIACLKSVTGEIATLNKGEGVFGGNNAEINRDSIANYYSEYEEKLGSKVFGAINCEFFSTNDDPTSLAFPLIKNKENIGDGYASKSEYQDPFYIETIDWKQGVFRKVTYADADDLGEAIKSNDEAQVVAGLDVEADKGPTSYTGRTFLSLYTIEGNENPDIAMIYNSGLATQVSAMQVLADDFGCEQEQTIMYDGGGSTQLTIKGVPYVSSSRTLPHVLLMVSK